MSNNIILVDNPADIMGAVRELAAMGAAEDAAEHRYEDDLLKRELYNVVAALYYKRIDFQTALEMCRILDATAADPLLSQDEAEALWQLWQDRIVTFREMLLLCHIMQEDRLRQRAERFNSKPVERETLEAREEQLVRSINERVSKESNSAAKPVRGSDVQ